MEEVTTSKINSDQFKLNMNEQNTLFNYIDFSQHNNKLTTIIFIIYSYMFRLT